MTILDGIPFLPAVHFTKGREAKIDTLVLHWIAGTLASADATFTGGRREASAHFGIEGTTVHQYVKDTDTAWHAGDRAVNHRSIGIEHSAQPATKTSPARPASPSTIATSVALCVALCRKYGISPDRIFPHKKFTATACPGTLPVAAIVAAVRAQLATQPVPTPAPAQPIPLEDNMKPFFIRAATGVIVIVGPTGVRHVTPGQWETWRNLGYGLAPGMSAMGPGPFAAVVASLGGLMPAGK